MSASDSKNSTPPATLHELLSLALADLALVEADPRYKVDMFFWHRPIGKVCNVCLAGSVMAKTLGTLPSVRRVPYEVSFEWQTALTALDFLRVGQLNMAIYRFHGKSHPRYVVDVPSYGDPKWRPCMWEIVQRLKELGL